MKVTVKVDTSAMKRRVDEMRARATLAGRELVVANAREAIRLVLAFSENWRDTNRYFRAWQIAGNDLGMGLPLVPLVEGKRSKQIGRRLLAQVRFYESVERFWQRRVDLNSARPGHEKWKSHRAAVAELAKRKKQADLARRTLAQYEGRTLGEGAIVIGGRATKKDTALGRLARVYTKGYGGYAVVTQVGGRWVVRAVNQTAHARLVEYGMARDEQLPDGKSVTVRVAAYRPVSRTMAALRAQGVTALSRSQYVRMVRGSLQKSLRG